MMGSSYIPLPAYIRNKKAVINIKNDDQKCFMWSILAALHPGRTHPENVRHYQRYEKEVNTVRIDFPTPISQISRFEKQNHISMNVFGYQKEIFPLHITKEKCNQHVNLLLFNQGEHRHFCLIRTSTILQTTGCL